MLDAMQLAASESICQVYVRRIKAEEVFVEKTADNSFQFPCKSGELEQPYGTSKSFSRFQKSFVNMEESDENEEILQDCDLGNESAEKSEAEEFPDNKGDSEDILDRDSYKVPEDDPEGQDFWSLNGTCLTRHHRVPRTKLFSLYDVTLTKPPIPLSTWTFAGRPTLH